MLRPGLALVALTLTLTFALASGAHAQQVFNPIVPSVQPPADDQPGDSADPFIVRSGGQWHVTYTAGDRIVLRSARTLDGIAGAPTRQLWPRPGESVPKARCCLMWAPELHRLRAPDGSMRWYVYAGSTDGDIATQQVQVLESAGDDPRGPYTYRGRLDTGRWAIDATILERDGRLFLFYSGHDGSDVLAQQLYVAPLENPWTVSGPSVRISEPTLPWETVGYPVDEGPEILVHAGQMDVIFSASACLTDQYALGRLTVPAAADLTDPATWQAAKAPQPVLTGRPDRDVYGPGHNGFFRSPKGGESWILYHAASRPGPGCFTGIRTPRAARFTYAADGTPRFAAPQPVAHGMRPPRGDGSNSVPAEGAPGARVVRDLDRYVGGAAARLTGRPLIVRVPVPRAGRYRVFALAGGDGQVALRGGARRPTPSARLRDVALGTRRLSRGRARLVVLGARGTVVDQLRIVRVGGAGGHHA